MNAMANSALLNQAKTVLIKNKIGDYTVPTNGLYPFQWNWDSGFVSIGFANYSLALAFSEIESLLSGQWANGMVPHIIFHSTTEESYFPNWDFWGAEVNAGAPQQVKTSGITQPPVLAFVLEVIYKKYPDNPEVLQFIRRTYDKIVDNHRFWYTYRDPDKEGLVFIYHPWESGRDNSPLWDEAMNRIDLSKLEMPEYQRRDTQIADAAERPTAKQYDQYVFQLLLGKKYKYDGSEIAAQSEFLIQDSLINALLIRSNESLIYLGHLLEKDTSEIESWQQKSIPAYRKKLWNSELNCFVCYDKRAEKQLAYREIGGIASLYAGIPNAEQAQAIHDYLERLANRGFTLVPSWDPDHPWFDSKRYWRGPVWPQMNWLIHHGLRRYNFDQMAEQVRSDFIKLVSNFGFCEYFETQPHAFDTGKGGYGGKHFSWTASTIIDFISVE